MELVGFLAGKTQQACWEWAEMVDVVLSALMTAGTRGWQRMPEL